MSCRDRRSPLSTFININEQRWDAIHQKLRHISDRLSVLNPLSSSPTLPTHTSSSSSSAGITRTDIVVSADPSNPPYSLKYYVNQLATQGRKVLTSVHLHGGSTPTITVCLHTFSSLNTMAASRLTRFALQAKLMLEHLAAETAEMMRLVKQDRLSQVQAEL